VKTILGIFGLVASLTLACSSGSGGGGTGGGGGFGNAGGNGGSTPVQSCASRCATLANDCGQDPGQCDQLCGAINEQQLVCLEGSSCDPQAAQACLSSGSGGSSSGSGGSSSSNGGSSSSSGGSSSGGAGLGDACDCPDEGDWVTCAGSGECASGLTCVEYGGQKLCTEECTPDTCSGSLSCTALLIGSIEMGTYCWPE